MIRRLILIMGLLLPAGIAHAGNYLPDIDRTLKNIEENMSAVKSVETDFVQEKSLKIFSQKLILKGKVFIQKSGLFSWRIFSPMR